ncbi:acyl-CoA dehydrogenase [Nocardia sp. NPDC005978]|uniref:acyl-CoA dehydrogenase family protein n=1 Tax=Nocardia sp. NPDC005978 TaxID=3156725 RepID=UPI0033A39A74
MDTIDRAPVLTHGSAGLHTGKNSAVQVEISKWFADKGAESLAAEDVSREFPSDYQAFLRSRSILSRTLCPEWIGGSGAEWTPRTIFGASETLAFGSFTHWLMWHVTSLSVLPVWMSGSSELQAFYAAALRDGQLGSFGMSEKGAGADWRKTATTLTRSERGPVLDGAKHYVGNAQVSPIITTFAADGPAFSFVRVAHTSPGFRLVRNAVPEQMFVAEFELDNCAVREADIIVSGGDAFFDAVNTINIGKVNLATAAIGLAGRALLETYRHTNGRSIFGVRTSDFGQNKEILSEATLWIIAMRSFLAQCAERMENAAASDRSFIVFNSVAKVFVTEMSESVIRSLTDVASAYSFESDSPLNAIRKFCAYLPRLEGTKYVNLMQMIKSAKAFVDSRGRSEGMDSGAVGAKYLLSHRGLGGLDAIDLGDWRSGLDAVAGLPNGAAFREFCLGFADWIVSGAAPRGERAIEAIGELYCVVVFGSEIAKVVSESESAPLWDATYGLVCGEALRLLLRHRTVLDELGFPARQLAAALGESRVRYPYNDIEDILAAAVADNALVARRAW